MASQSSRDLIRLLHSPTTRPSHSRSNPVPSATTPALLDRRADFPVSSNGYTGSGAPYDAGSTGRRLTGWSPSRLGPSTSLWSTHDLILARCHDEVRNNPWAASSVDNFESQIVGNGIKPKWNIRNEKLKLKIEKAFHRSACQRTLDVHGLCDFYGLQALAAREIFEGGEVFIRRFLRPEGWLFNPNDRTTALRIPFQIQLIESEQVPIWLNMSAGGAAASSAPGNTVRTGKEFDSDQRLVAFHMFREHPGETMFFPMSGPLAFIRVTSDNILHCYKPFRAGLLRGQPHLSSVLVLLHELTKYTDATVVAKQIQTMFAGFITKTSAEADILPPDPNVPVPGFPNMDPATRNAHLETGSLLELLPGESVSFPTLPQNTDMATFMSVMLHQFAVAIGSTYEQITGDLRGVNLSSIRSGVQDAHRKCEQFIYNVMVTQFCQPFIRWWLDAAVLSGELRLPGYATEPEQYLDITWNTSGWPWLDPAKDVEAKKEAVRAGFTSRETVCAETGEDAEKIDEQTVRNNERTDRLDLVYTTDPRKVLEGKEANPKVPEEGEPEAESQVDPNPDNSDAPPKPTKSSSLIRFGSGMRG